MNQTAKYLQSASNTREIEISQLVNCLLQDAIGAGATDIHIEPWEKSVAVRIRLDGVLTELIHLPLDLMERILQRLKIMATMVSYQADLPQEGHVAPDPAFGGADLRVSFFPTVRGGKIVVRLFDPSSRSFDLNTLGLDEDILDKFAKLLARPTGLILLTGPTGCGKTTTIYSALLHILQRSGPAVSISTVEDPVEFQLPMISQAQMNPQREFTYPVALRSLLRQDPQVIMVGEIRDPETATIALQAGLTGHLVISTIHSGSSPGVFARLINMEIEPFLLASSIIGIMGLRLIRRNCEPCMQPYQPEPALLKFLSPEMIDNAYFRRGVGCPQCHQTGFSGRVSLAELLVVNDALRDAVLQRMPTGTLQKVAIEQGMQTLWQRGLARALAGQTPLEEILRVVAVDQT
jgi:type II secretory ATPase GspE/PulE/Tfp pilus assembly ATPase PilB-like protein